MHACFWIKGLLRSKAQPHLNSDWLVGLSSVFESESCASSRKTEWISVNLRSVLKRRYTERRHQKTHQLSTACRLVCEVKLKGWMGWGWKEEWLQLCDKLGMAGWQREQNPDWRDIVNDTKEDWKNKNINIITKQTNKNHKSSLVILSCFVLF